MNEEVKKSELQALREQLEEAHIKLKQAEEKSRLYHTMLESLPRKIVLLDNSQNILFQTKPEHHYLAEKMWTVSNVENSNTVYQLQISHRNEYEFGDYHYIFNSIKDALVIFDHNGVIIETNRAFCDLIGYPLNQIMYKRIYDFSPAAWETFEKERILAPQLDIQNYTLPYRKEYRHADGTRIPVEQRVYRLDTIADNEEKYWLLARDLRQDLAREKHNREREDYFKQLFENMIEGLAHHEMIYDEQGKPIDYNYLDVNPAFEQLLNLRRKDIIGRSVKEIIPNIEQKWIDLYGKVAQHGIANRFEDYSEALGKFYEIQVYSPSKDRFITIFSDITKRKIAENQLIEREEELNTIFESVPIILILLNSNREVININRKGLEANSLNILDALGQLTGKVLSCLHVHDSVKGCGYGPFCSSCKIQAIIRRCFETEMNQPEIETDFWIKLNNKPQKIEIRVSAAYLRQGKEAKVLLAAYDITDQRAVARNLEESEQRYKLLTALSREGIVIHRNDIILDLNPAFEDLSAKLKEELVGSPFLETFIPVCYHPAILEQIETEGPGIVQAEFVLSNNQKRYIELSTEKIKYFGKPAFVSTIRDVTESLTIGKRLSLATMEAEERERTYFAAELHDGIGPLLASAKIYLKAIMQSKNPQRASLATHKLSETLEESLRSLREISNHISPHVLRNFGLETALKAYVAKLNGIGELSIELQTNITIKLDNVVETSLYRIATELITNTIKHAGATKITLELSTEKPGRVQLWYSDNGQGFDTSAQFTGMGLSNMRNRVIKLNGRFNLKSAENQGAQYLIELDAAAGLAHTQEN